MASNALIYGERPMVPDLADVAKDLEFMLSPLRQLPAVSGIARDVDGYVARRPAPIEVEVTLELDLREPTTDFVRQLFELAYQLSTTGGVALPRAVLLIAKRLVQHAEAVSEAWPAAAPRPLR